MNSKLTLIITAALLAAALPVQAAIVGPYTVDANTLHLWHLDESSGTVVDSAGSHDLENVSGVTQGAAAFTGFGSAAQWPSSSSSAEISDATATSHSTYQGSDGAFTVEALVNLSSISVGDEQYIFNRRANSPSGYTGYEFRVHNGNLDLLTFGFGGVQTISAAIPTTGEHAFVAGEWFHVAATYSGSDDATNSVLLYWTRLDSQYEQANLIGDGSTSDASVVDAPTFLGNRSSSTTENPFGSIDEVRISNVARGADEMMFAVVPEPTTVALLGLGGLALAGAARRRRPNR